MSPDLENLRTTLDELDNQLVDTLAKRQMVVDLVASQKKADGSRVFDSQREQEILARLTGLGQDKQLDRYYLQRIFREIFDYSTRRQVAGATDEKGNVTTSSITVGHLGRQASYTQVAAARHFGARDEAIDYHSFESIQLVLKALTDGAIQYGVVPIENTTAGAVNASYDLVAQMDLSFVGEVELEIRHALLGNSAASMNSIRRIYSHPQAIDQCAGYLAGLVNCTVESVSDTATAAWRVAGEDDSTVAAIASAEAAEYYGLRVLASEINDYARNYTRFMVVARKSEPVMANVPCKTSIMFATSHDPGALVKCLGALDNEGLNLTKLQSRPRPGVPWEYLFYVDLEGHIDEPAVARGLESLSTTTSYLRVFGSYPRRINRQLDALPRPTTPLDDAMVTARTPEPEVVPPKPVEKEPAKKSSSQAYRLVSRDHREEDLVIRVGDAEIGGDRPVVIAGPCSVESREQIEICARLVKDSGAELLRGGCFKPRTSPYSFQGLGVEGLALLKEAGERYELPVVTEVLDASDVRMVAQYADVLQIGARNMQNYSLLNEVGKVDRPVLLKRGMMSTIDEWLAAAEYIVLKGNRQVILCERGIRTFETSTRHTLDISAIPVVKERSYLPIIIDPSHAAGTRRWVVPMSAASVAAGADGLMVEIHPNPEQALCDGPQALTEEGLNDLMSAVKGASYK